MDHLVMTTCKFISYNDYSKKGDDGVSNHTTYEKGNDGLIKWKDYKKTSGYDTT